MGGGVEDRGEKRGYEWGGRKSYEGMTRFGQGRGTRGAREKESMRGERKEEVDEGVERSGQGE